MSKTSVNQVIQRAVSDAAFRRQLQRDPGAALKGFDLTADERAAISSGDPARLTGLGVDQRMSKAFAIGGLAGASNSVIEIDPGQASGDEVIVGDPGSASVSAFDPTTSAGGRSAALTDPARSEDTSAIGGTDNTGDLSVIDPGAVEARAAVLGNVDTAGGRSAALTDPARSEDTSAIGGTDTTGDLSVIDPGAVEARAAVLGTVDTAGGRSAALTDPARSEDTSAFGGTDTAGGRSAALTDPARTEDMEATAFEPESASGDLNVIDPGIVTNDTVESSGSTDGVDTGGEVRPTEF